MQYNLHQSVTDLVAIIEAVQNEAQAGDLLFAEALADIQPGSSDTQHSEQQAAELEIDQKPNDKLEKLETLENSDEPELEAQEDTAEEEALDHVQTIEVAQLNAMDMLYTSDAVLLSDGLEYVVENIEEEEEHGSKLDFFTILINENNMLADISPSSNGNEPDDGPYDPSNRNAPPPPSPPGEGDNTVTVASNNIIRDTSTDSFNTLDIETIII